MSFKRLFLTGIACVTGLTQGVLLADSTSDYLSQVKPLLKSRCYACHGALKQEGGLRLDTAASIRAGGDSGEIVLRGAEAQASLLLERVATEDVSSRMPPEHEGEPLNEKELAILRNWVTAGTPAPDEEVPEADPRDHWAFQQIQRPDLPQIEMTPWIRNPVDHWIAAGYQQQKMSPQPEASRLVLLRRLYFDLIGLPPTAQEISACLEDSSPDWYEKIVDRLLADPRHGERWARHWMDIWRYSDWWGLGDQLRNSQKHLWHWRDWIVESLNQDLPYDEMVRLMLAADELAPDDLSRLRATGYLARNYYIFNRTQWLDETVEHFGKAFLGLTMNCAKCHDHKYDPIDQVAYYQLRAFFEPYQVRLDMVPGELDVQRNGIPRVFDGVPDAPTYLFVRGEESRADKSKVIAPGLPEILTFDELTFDPVSLPETAWNPGVRPWVIENQIAAAKTRLKSAKEHHANLLRDSLSGESPNEGSSPRFQPISELFTTLDQSRWKLNGNGWAHQPGRMEQNQDGQVHSTLTLLEQVPRNFDAVLKFQIQGGSRWRSVGLSFDGDGMGTTNAQETRQLIYLSGAQEDSKIQGAFFKGGKWNYPGEGRKSFAVELGKEYTLQVRARGNLINVSLNGEPVLSWRTPLERRTGTMQLTTFDAIAVFSEFRLEALDHSVSMKEPDQSSSNAQAQLERAEAEVHVAEADLKSIEARAAAMGAHRDQADSAVQSETKNEAIRAERQWTVEKLRRDVLIARQTLALAEEKQREDAGKKLTAAEEALATGTAVLNSEISLTDNFTPLNGATWSPTRFQHTGHDDPTISSPQTSTGRRTALARWMTDRRNPLVARVAVNHLWNRHLGEPLAATPFDLGRNSPDPVHPELIDWLASELMDHGWSMKHIHRLIVTSSAYRLSSSLAGAEEQLAKDPDNRFLWRRVPIRVESQVVRDVVLSLAGTLDLTVGGPSVPPGAQDKSLRRSLYFFHSNNDRNLFLTTFDEAEVGECYRREQSVVPQQALALMNSDLILGAADQIAGRIGSQSGNDTEFVRQAFLQILGIAANDTELQTCLSTLERWQADSTTTSEQARARLVWILLNHNDFITLR